MIALLHTKKILLYYDSPYIYFMQKKKSIGRNTKQKIAKKIEEKLSKLFISQKD